MKKLLFTGIKGNCVNAFWCCCALLGLGSQVLVAIKYSNQNNLVTRAPGKDIYLRDLGWYEVKRDAENLRNCSFASAFQVNFFYQKLNQLRDVGSYFGVKGKAQGISYAGGSLPVADLESNNFIHDAIRDNYEFTSDLMPGAYFRYKKPSSSNPQGTVVEITDFGGTVKKDPLTGADLVGPTTLETVNLKTALEEFGARVANNRAMQGLINLKVDRKVWGVLCSYYAYTKAGLWFAFDVPFLQIKNTLVPKMTEEARLWDPELDRDVSMEGLLSGKYNLSADFVGVNKDNPDAQNRLQFSKFALQEQTQSGLGDFDITMGYRLLNHEKFDADAYLKLSIPTAEEITPEFLFPPQLGNNGHFATAVGTSCSCDLWSDATWTLEGLGNFAIAYSFSKTQHRTLSSLVDRGVSLPWDKYILVHEMGVAGPLQPLANVLTTEVKVSPGFSMESFLSLGIRGSSFVGNLGITAFTRQGEQVEVGKWAGDNLYGRPSTVKYRSSDVFDEADYPFEAIDVSSITQSELQTITASTPGSLSMNFFAQIGYFVLDPKKKPLTACLGFAYEMCSENSALNHFTVWMKVGLAF